MVAPAFPCEACRYEPDWLGRISWVSCVRPFHAPPEVTPFVQQPAKHGTLGNYINHKCRCAPCRQAMADYRAKRKAQKLAVAA